MPVRDVDKGADALMRRMRQQASVKVGIIGPKASAGKQGGKGVTVVDVASWCHFGVPPYNPPRPFISQPVDNNEDELKRRLQMAAKLVAKGSHTVEQALNLFGLHVVGLMQDAISNREYEANAEATVRRKGSSTPLIDTGQLRSSIIHEVTGGRRA